MKKRTQNNEITITFFPHRTLIEIPDSELLLEIGVRNMGIPLDCSKYRKWDRTIEIVELECTFDHLIRSHTGGSTLI